MYEQNQIINDEMEIIKRNQTISGAEKYNIISDKNSLDGFNNKRFEWARKKIRNLKVGKMKY